jgi:Asp-tRNA(Asn)/Glu-tRNA(Gln) amidotransferase B subunit
VLGFYELRKDFLTLDIQFLKKNSQLKQMTDTGAIEQIVDEIIKNNASQVAQFKSGNEKILGFFVGHSLK